MCGGVREFESMRTPEGLLKQKLGDGCTACEMKHAQNQEQLSRRSKQNGMADAAAAAAVPPAGLAILAAMGGNPATPAHSPVLPTPSVRGPVTKLHLIAAQDMNGIPARQWRPARAIAASAGACLIAAPPARGRKRTDDRSSIFYCALSPPTDLVAIATVPARPSADFLGACCLCRRPLGSGTDIFMYRGDRAFCSNDCRYQQIMEDERSDRVLLQQPKTLPARDCKHGRVDASASPMILPVVG